MFAGVNSYKNNSEIVVQKHVTYLMSTPPGSPLQNLNGLSAVQLRRLLTEHLTKQRLGLYWESNAIERDAGLNANIVLPRVLSSENGHKLI